MKVSVVRMAIDRVRKDPRSVIIAIDSLLPLTRRPRLSRITTGSQQRNPLSNIATLD
jgi:hypothetical protein